MAWGRNKQGKTQPTSSGSSAANAGKFKENPAPTIIGSSLVVRGEVETDQAMFVKGKIIGQVVSTSSVHVGTTGIIEGDVKCETILVEGQVKGNVEASSNITIEATGRLSGDTYTPEFINRQGFFEGYSHMTDDSRRKQAPGKKQAKNKENEKAGTAES